MQREIWALKAAYSVSNFFEVNVPKKFKGGLSLKFDAFKTMFEVAEKILQREIWALKAAYSVFNFFEVNVPKKVERRATGKFDAFKTMFAVAEKILWLG